MWCGRVEVKKVKQSKLVTLDQWMLVSLEHGHRQTLDHLPQRRPHQPSRSRRVCQSHGPSVVPCLNRNCSSRPSHVIPEMTSIPICHKPMNTSRSGTSRIPPSPQRYPSGQVSWSHSASHSASSAALESKDKRRLENLASNVEFGIKCEQTSIKRRSAYVIRPTSYRDLSAVALWACGTTN